MNSATPQPERRLISVVIASVSGMPEIGECLSALTSQEGNFPYELLVLDRCGDETRAKIRQRFVQSEVRLLPVDGCPSIPRLRAIGMAAAEGRVIAILEDHCNVPPGWFEAIARAHAEGHQVIGGGVENGATDRLIDWAVFFCEYARFMPPVSAGITSEIPGNCAVYDRALLQLFGTELKDEVWEFFLHRRLQEEGIEFFCDPDMTVSHKKSFRFWYFMSQRYYYSRSFAAMRMVGEPLLHRIVYACTTPALPFLLFARMAKCIWRKRRRQKEFIGAIPIILPFLMSWAWGEAVGALFGAGGSLERVE
jgi:GT2 family glycosyltransferase